MASVKKAGEKYHGDAVELSRRIIRGGHDTLSSALVLVELPGALAASTNMPVEKIYEVEASAGENIRLSIMAFEPYVERAVEFMFEFRDLKSRWEIGSADFHYLATSYQEGCEFFVTTDERHLLRTETRKVFSKYLKVLAPDEAVDALESKAAQ